MPRLTTRKRLSTLTVSQVELVGNLVGQVGHAMPPAVG
jgi:hypothetical protein